MTIPRPLTTTELSLVSSPNQASKLYLAFPESHVVFAAQVNGTPSSLDKVVKIAYDNVTAGAYTDIPVMSTLWVGTAAGLYDKGIARIRLAADATYLYIGETSSINFADGDYLTVVNDFLFWQRFPRQRTTKPETTYADWDIKFEDQNPYVHPNPVVNMGPDAVIYVPDGVISTGNPASTSFDASGSFMPDGSAIASHLFVAYGTGISITNPTTATPTVTVTQTGTWKISDTATGANGKTTTAWRTVVAFDQTHPPVNQFNLTTMPSGDLSSGGWSFTVRMYDQAAFASVKDRQQVILFARDWYTASDGTLTEISLGPITDRENIICEGWIDKQTMHFDPNGAYVDFTVQGLAFWMDQGTQYILGISDKDGTSSDWINIHHMTWDFGLFAVLYWHTTLCFMADYYPTGDTRPVLGMSEAEGSLWAQLKSSAWSNLLALNGCNRYGQFFAFIPPDLIPSASRSGIPVIMDASKSDTELGKTDIDRITTPPVGFLAAAAGKYAWGSNQIASELLAYAPGSAYGQFGKPDTSMPQILVTSQAQFNNLTALYISRLNNVYLTVPIPLVQNNRFVDIAPAQFVHLHRDASDNPRGIEFDGNVIPNKVTLTFDAKSGFLQTEVDGYAETFEDLVVTGALPSPTPPTSPVLPPTPLPIYPPTPWQTPGSGIKGALVANGTFQIAYEGIFSAGQFQNMVRDAVNSFSDTDYLSIDQYGAVIVLKPCSFIVVGDGYTPLENGSPTDQVDNIFTIEIDVRRPYGTIGLYTTLTAIKGQATSFLISSSPPSLHEAAVAIAGPLLASVIAGDYIAGVVWGAPTRGASYVLSQGYSLGTVWPCRFQFLIVG